MKAVAYSIKSYEKELLVKSNRKKHELTLISNRLTIDTVSYAKEKDAVIVFTGDDLSAPVLQNLHALGVRYLLERATGTDNIDLEEAERLGMKVANIPAYSPESVAEHAVALLLALCRNLVPAHRQMMEDDFSLDALVGTTLSNKTVGVVGFGQIGQALVRILRGFGARVLVSDTLNVAQQCIALGATQVSLIELYAASDIISFHVPLNEQSRHMVNTSSIAGMKDGVLIINVSRGAIFNSEEVFKAVQSGKISKLGMDVYEFEQGVFFVDHSHHPVQDHLLKALIQHSRVLITPHAGFLTTEALLAIAEKTIENLDRFAADKAEADAPRNQELMNKP